MEKNLTQLDVLAEWHARELLDENSEVFKQYSRVKNGYHGELECMEWLRKYLQEGVVIHHDVELEYNGRTQVDLLVLADEVWWVVEVKYYAGIFEYRQQVSSLSGYAISSDPIAQMRNRMRIMKELVNRIDTRIRVEGSMIFIHPESEVRMDSEEDIAVVMRHQLGRHLRDMRQRYKFQKNLNAAQYYEIIRAHHYQYPVTFPSMTDEIWKKIRKGCRCNGCGGYKLEASRKCMHCLDCDKVMKKSDLAKDLYCQLCVLFHDREYDITYSRLNELSDFQLSRSGLHLSLSKFLPSQNKYRSNYLENHRLPREKMDHIFGEKK